MNHNTTESESPITYRTDMQQLYQFTEGEFLEFDKIVPMNLNKEMSTVSPKLYFLLMAICGQIESLVIHICRDIDMYNDNDSFFTCYKNLWDKSDVIEKQSVQIITTREIIRPFGKTENGTPSWWASYNKVKHTIPEGLEHATVKNTVCALGGLYLLLNLYKLIPRIPKDILDTQCWLHNRTMFRPLSKKNNEFSYVQDRDYKSNLFILKSHFKITDE